MADRRRLAIAFAGSLILNAFVLTVPLAALRAPRATPPDVLVIDRLPPAPRARPTPPPHRRSPHRARAVPHGVPLRMHVPQREPVAGSARGLVARERGPARSTAATSGSETEQGASTGAGASVGTPAAAPTAPATPVPTPTPLSCARPNVPATTIHAVEPEMPPLAQASGISGTVGVVVSLDAQSRVVAVRIASSPNALLDTAALATARGSQFRTEVRDCVPIAADYLFTVEFSAD